MRLTEKDRTLKLESITDIKWNKAIDKLGQLEDIEDELGIEITDLYKKFKEANETMKKNGTSTKKVWFKLFGKTWALTKEELL